MCQIVCQVSLDISLRGGGHDSQLRVIITLVLVLVTQGSQIRAGQSCVYGPGNESGGAWTVENQRSSTLGAYAVVAQERRPAPHVPAEMLDGQRLVDKQSGFSIEAPQGWTWLYLPPSPVPADLAESVSQFRNYAASSPDGRTT